MNIDDFIMVTDKLYEEYKKNDQIEISDHLKVAFMRMKYHEDQHRKAMIRRISFILAMGVPVFLMVTKLFW